MATRGIEIPLSLNPAKLIRGMKITEREFEDLERAVEDVAKEGDELERDLEANFRSIRGASKKAGRGIESDLDDGLNQGGKAREYGSEIGSEFSQNIGEAFRSGDVGGSIFETFTSLGPALGVGGIAIGAGAAIIKGIADGMNAQKELVKERVAGFADTAFETLVERARESGKVAGVEWVAGLYEPQQQLDAISETLGVEAPEALTALKQLSEEWGVPVAVIKDALLGNAEALATIKDRQSEIQSLADLSAEAARNQLTYTGETSAVLDAQAAQYATVLSDMEGIVALAEGVQTEQDIAVAGVEAYAEIWGTDVAQNVGTVKARVEDIEQPTERVTGKVGEVKRELQEAGVAAKTIKDTLGGIPKQQTVTVTVNYVPKGKPPKGDSPQP